MELVTRALGYPYSIPSTSYVLDRGQVRDWDETISLKGRIPILACGSNQSPEQLARKFPFETIPVMAGWLDGYDSVYSAHYTSYGSISATLMAKEGVRSRQMITWLEADYLNLMHDSEALGINYTYVELSGLSFTSDCNKLIEKAGTYLSLHGVLKHENEPIALAAITASGRTYPAIDQESLQASVLRDAAYEGSLEDYISQTVSDDVLRLERTERLKHGLQKISI